MKRSDQISEEIDELWLSWDEDPAFFENNRQAEVDVLESLSNEFFQAIEEEREQEILEQLGPRWRCVALGLVPHSGIIEYEEARRIYKEFTAMKAMPEESPEEKLKRFIQMKLHNQIERGS